MHSAAARVGLCMSTTQLSTPERAFLSRKPSRSCQQPLLLHHQHVGVQNRFAHNLVLQTTKCHPHLQANADDCMLCVYVCRPAG